MVNNNANSNLYDINNIEYFKKQYQEKYFKRKRLVKFRLFLLILLVLLVIYLISPLSKINSITIVGNQRFTKDEILNKISLHEKSFTFIHPQFLIKMQLKNSDYYSSINVTKSWLGDVKITIKEYRLLFYDIDQQKQYTFYDEKGNKFILKGNILKKYQGNYPQLVSKINDELKEKLINTLGELDESVVSLMSEIIYTPKQYDKEFFKIIMNGSKQIYLYSSLNYLVKVGSNYHNFAANTQYQCSKIEFIDNSNKAIVTKC
jgi:cell division protein FtsQ